MPQDHGEVHCASYFIGGDQSLQNIDVCLGCFMCFTVYTFFGSSYTDQQKSGSSSLAMYHKTSPSFQHQEAVSHQQMCLAGIVLSAVPSPSPWYSCWQDLWFQHFFRSCGTSLQNSLQLSLSRWSPGCARLSCPSLPCLSTRTEHQAHHWTQ